MSHERVNPKKINVVTSLVGRAIAEAISGYRSGNLEGYAVVKKNKRRVSLVIGATVDPNSITSELADTIFGDVAPPQKGKPFVPLGKTVAISMGDLPVSVLTIHAPESAGKRPQYIPDIRK